jgi:hypothetical protein
LLQEKTEKEILHKNSPKVKTQNNSGHTHKTRIHDLSLACQQPRLPQLLVKTFLYPLLPKPFLILKKPYKGF